MAETINTQTTGYECVGIEKIEQTYEGLFDNKPNIITIYLTNGDTHQFKVMNGSQGVGIDRIEQRQTSSVSGGRNEFAIILTNGKEYTFSTYNGSGGSGSSGSFNQVLQQLNNMLMPSGKSYLYYNGSGFEWKSPDGSTGGGTADLSEYSWWGRKFAPASKMITGEMSAVTSIEFQSTKGETTIKKKLYLDENGDLCFDGNLYATGGITALGCGGGTSGGGSSSTLYPFTIYNGSSDNDYITYDGSSAAYLKFKRGFSISKVGLGYEISATGGSGGVTLNPTMSQMNKYLTKTTLNTPQFLYWDGTTYTWKNESEIGGGSGGSIQVAQTPEHSGESEDWVSATKLRFVGISDSTKPTVLSNSVKGCIDIGIPVGSGSGSNSRIKKIKLFTNNSNSSFETVELGSADTIGFMAGDNVSLQAVVKEYTNVIKISANVSSSGGSSGGSVSWADVTNKPSTFTPSSHTHSTNDIDGLNDYVKGIKVNYASKANQLTFTKTIWGQSFNGTADVNGHLKMGTAGGGSIQLWMNGGNILDRTGNTLHIGYGLKESSDGEINLDANVTKVYTDNYSKHYDFKSNVFDVNSNQIHFGTDSNGGKISWDADNNAFKIDGNVYATGGITALGVSNSATTSNNVDFTFKSVTADSATFDKLYLRKEYGYGLFVGTKCALWGAVETDAIHIGGNFTQVYMTEWIVINSNSKQCYCATRLQTAKGLSLLDGYLDVKYNGTTYKFDFAKAKELGLLINAGVKTLSDEVDYTNVIQ